MRSAAADTAYLGCGSADKTLTRPCILRLSAVAGAGLTHWLRQLAAVWWAEMLPNLAPVQSGALGPMLPASAREHWPFFVLQGVTQLCRTGRVCRKLARDWWLSLPTKPTKAASYGLHRACRLR